MKRDDSGPTPAGHRWFNPESRMRALEITGENLEDLLAYDDLFLDYFNAFLALPVFPQALIYNRLTGAFEETEIPATESATGSRSSHSVERLHYGPTDRERDTMLEWARRERLPLFISTQLFREFKLCKLLLRPLDDRYSASRGSSRQLRGYSRQSESYVSSLSNSVDNSANDAIDDEDFAFSQIRHSALFRYQRPGSRAISVPVKIYFENSDEYGSTRTETQDSSQPSKSAVTSHKKEARVSSQVEIIPLEPRDSGHGTSQPTHEDGKPTRENTMVTFDPRTDEQTAHSRRSSKYSKNKRPPPPPTSDAEEAFMRHARALSAPINYEDYMRHPFFGGDYDMLMGEEEPEPNGHAYVQFEDEGVSEEQTENDLKNMEGRFKMSLQQFKEHFLGSHAGMQAFIEFLINTAGDHLVSFWLDCEYFKDMMEDFDEVVHMETRNTLFRDIQDKYKMNLTTDAKEQLNRSASNASLVHTVFIRTQYDVLRRLRAYWVPRFLIHLGRSRTLHSSLGNRQPLESFSSQDIGKDSFPFFPSISLVKSMPVRPDDVLAYSRTKSWDRVSRCGSAFESRVISAKVRTGPLHSSDTATKERFIMALSADKHAGGPFRRFLERKEDQELLSNLMFWEDVTEYWEAEDRSSDRLLRLCHAWGIYNKYLAENPHHNVGVSQQERDDLHNALLNARDFIEASVFNTVKSNAVEKLEKAWIRFLKEDLKGFLDCYVRSGGGNPPGTADAIEITITDGEVVIRRPRPWVKRLTPGRHPGSTESERGRRLLTALSVAESIDEGRRVQMREKARERRKEMEKERKKAIKAAYKRVREAKQMKKSDSKSKEEGDHEAEFDVDVPEEKAPKPPPPFHDMSANKTLMTNFKKHLLETDDKDKLYMVNLYLDIDNYLSIGSSKKDAQKKDSQAHYIQKTYIDSHGKKRVTFSDKIHGKLGAQKDRPHTPALKDMQHFVSPKLDDIFKAYVTTKAEENLMEPGDFVRLSQAELSMRMGGDAGMMKGWNKKGKGKADSSASDLLTSVPSIPSIPQIELSNTSLPANSPRKPRKVGKGVQKQTGRAQPHKDDREEFFKALKQSAAGHPTLQMLYFYKYLVKHGEDDHVPLLDKNLFFYIEAQKFKDCSHAHADEELMKKKVQSILDCFLESITSPSLQVSIHPDLQQRCLRGAQRYLGGKEGSTNIFDDAQLHVFKELLPYWAGFKKSYSPPDDPNTRPVTKHQKLMQKRLANIENYKIPSSTFNLPRIPEGAAAAYSFSLSDGVKWREASSDEAQSRLGTPLGELKTKHPEVQKKRRMSHASSMSDPHSRRSSVAVR